MDHSTRSVPAGEEAVHVAFDDVRMDFGGRAVFRGLNCSFPKGKFSVIVGGSGVGKSTMLRLMGGLIPPSSGRILVDGTDITDLSEREMMPVRRKLGMLFQGGALLDATTVYDNLAFPLREHTTMSAKAIRVEVHDALSKVGLQPHDGRLLPSELSGGMVKRVALARALIMKPVILLCDEPFSGLDPISAKRIELLLTRINRVLGMTLIVVSHDAQLTMRVADHVLVLLPDRIAEGPPQEVCAQGDARIVSLLCGEVDESLVQSVVRSDADVTLASGDLESTWS